MKVYIYYCGAKLKLLGRYGIEDKLVVRNPFGGTSIVRVDRISNVVVEG
jgi:hypothetical protein